MNLASKQLLFSVLPRPRRPVTVSRALPLILFLALFLGGCLALQLGRVLSFTRPEMFWLMAVSPWIWWMHVAGGAGLGGTRAVAALLVRLCLLATLVLALTEPRAVRTSNTLTVVYALDMSDSIGDKLSDEALKFVARTAGPGRPEKDEAGFIVFGRNAAVELPPRMSMPLDGIEAINSRVSRDGTDLEKALSLAAAMIPEENEGRVVLITDGTATEGNLSRALDEIRSRRIPVDVVGVNYDNDKEVWVEKLELPRSVKIGETYEAAVVVSALAPGKGKLTLQENGRAIATQDVEFAAGKNRYVMPLYLRSAGYYEYVARIETAEKNDWAENNVAINYLYLKGAGKVLVVTDPQGEPQDAARLVKALKESERLVEVQDAYDFPRDAFSLLPYDAVVLVNVPADAFDMVQMQAAHDAVYNQGIGLLMVGGQNSFGPGGYHRSPIEEALPVTMDITEKKILPKGALAIILHTCEFNQGNTWAKRITKEAINVLGKQDEVGVIYYGMGAQWLFPLTPAGEYKKLIELINNCEPGDMPDFQTSMQMGLDGLKESDAAVKHMIIISDGDPQAPTPKLLQDFTNERITVTTISVFPHGGTEVQLLETIANATGGRYYNPKDPNILPRLFIKEAKTLKKSMIQNKTFLPSVEFPSEILKGIDALLPLHGYVLTSPKPRSTTILKGPETEQVDPILATWRYGIGKSAAFTSDLAPNWGKDWVEWDKYQSFVKQLIIDVSRADVRSDLQMRAFAEGSKGIVIVEDAAKDESFLEIEMRVAGPRDQQETIKLKQVAPRRYQGEFPLWGKGRYQVSAIATGGGRNETAFSGFAVAYSPEYLRFRSNPIVLEEIAKKTGGRLLTPDATGQDVFKKEQGPRQRSRPIFDWFLIALAILVPLDVGVRRVQLDWYVIRAWFGIGKKQKSTETLVALLRRKQDVALDIEAKRAETPMPAPTRVVRPVTPVTPKTPTAPQQPPPASEPGDAPKSTTGRLLAAKKRRSQDGKEN